MTTIDKNGLGPCRSAAGTGRCGRAPGRSGNDPHAHRAVLADGILQRSETDGFAVTDCSIDGKRTNFARWLTENEVDMQLPLIADYNGALINVSIQRVDKEAGKVALYAPVFRGRTYRRAKPVPDYVQAFRSATAGMNRDVPFACNCVLNFVYGQLEGAHVGLPGPFTFGEIAFQLLNQTMVYCDVVDAAAHKGAGLAKALECYQQAVALDERIAPAHAGIAEAYTLLAFLGLRAPKEVMPEAATTLPSPSSRRRSSCPIASRWFRIVLLRAIL